jgi:hypothetical protein
MRWLLGTGLAVLIAHGDVCADPSAPQVTPAPGRREDAQRLREQLRGLERVPAPAAVALPSAAAAATTMPGAASAEPDPGNGTANKIAWGLLAVAAASGIATLTLISTTSQDSPNRSSYDSAETALSITAVATGSLGFLILARSASVKVSPTVTPKAVGLAISGRL